ncbi:cardiolipin synthase [Brachybacterium saurashtrense]|uniref:Cardiolipin synthase n=1 Tax=Brachybacterium saurashtrense TaxID=556288 RepID=A0A345YTB2_9MICO|nr:cardiolipin synthase [Brachybacterium saurashtrense]AXK47164.1 cardiolipin synthase [Brachybacterium saurashtrense]RRR21786.1 cardiolipin synthase [Brachybacterium saurashtrense]
MSESLTVLAALLAVGVALAHVVFCIAALGVIPGRSKPSSGMAWLILILAVPVVGAVGYLLLGNTTVGRRRRGIQRDVDEQLRLRHHSGGTEEGCGADTWSGISRLNQELGGLPLIGGNGADILDDQLKCMAAMCREIARAQRSVHVEFYIAAWDRATADFFDELVAAAERGVAVRLLFDHLGTRGIPGYPEFLRRLDASPIRWEKMLPIAPLKGQTRRPDLRNHRKILVVDGQVAFTGSQNLIEPGYNKPKNHRLGREWVDLMVRLQGPVVRQLETVFATDWFAETDEDLREELRTAEPVPDDVDCQVVPSGPGYVTENNLRMFNSLIYAATSKLSITSPYFVPDESLLYAVTTAARRGVEVELFASAEADQFMVHHAQRSYYRALLDAGVRIWLYPAPAILHAKHVTVDGAVAVVGSSNMDMRSFALDYEVVVVMHDAAVVSRLAEVQDNYRELSSELTLAGWRRRSWWGAYMDNVMRLTAALQ